MMINPEKAQIPSNRACLIQEKPKRANLRAKKEGVGITTHSNQEWVKIKESFRKTWYCRFWNFLFRKKTKICFFCEKEINKNELSKKEYRISGLCQKCQKGVFGKDKKFKKRDMKKNDN